MRAPWLDRRLPRLPEARPAHLSTQPAAFQRSLTPFGHNRADRAKLGAQERDMKQVLVVDDSPVIRKIARRILEGMRFQTSEAENGKEALAACSFLMPDAIMLDWNMPILDGFDVLKQLRRLPGGDSPKVVFCMSEYDVAQIARAMHVGADEIIMKPFDREIVKSKFEAVGMA
jgi:two-component system chemotaxis response regulator CheY